MGFGDSVIWVAGSYEGPTDIDPGSGVQIVEMPVIHDTHRIPGTFVMLFDELGERLKSDTFPEVSSYGASALGSEGCMYVGGINYEDWNGVVVKHVILD